MKFRELSIPNSFEITPAPRKDDRGMFLEWYRHDLLQEAVGHPLQLRQANMSVSQKGVVRGIHFADIPWGQAKYVTAVSGAVLDFVIDIRVGSPTFGEWDSVLLDETDRRAVYIAEGLGHAFVALTEFATVSYLVSDVYSPLKERGINPLDRHIGLVFPDEAGELKLSPKDLEASSLDEALLAGVLPNWADAQNLYQELDQLEAEKCAE